MRHCHWERFDTFYMPLTAKHVASSRDTSEKAIPRIHTQSSLRLNESRYSRYRPSQQKNKQQVKQKPSTH